MPRIIFHLGLVALVVVAACGVTIDFGLGGGGTWAFTTVFGVTGGGGSTGAGAVLILTLARWPVMLMVLLGLT